MEIEHNIFLLMLNLVQNSDRDKIINIYVESINSLQECVRLSYQKDRSETNKDEIQISTIRNSFGWFCVEVKEECTNKDLAIIRNSIKMLAVILENCLQREQLSMKNFELEIEVQSRIKELKIKNNQLLDKIDEKVNIENELRESEQRFRELAENLVDVFFIIENSSLLYINSVYEELWGFDRIELFNSLRNFIDLVYESDKEKVEKIYNNYKKFDSIDEQFRIVNNDKTIRWVRMRAFTVKNSLEYSRVVGVLEDTTKLKIAEENIINAMEVAKSANKAKSQFLANMSHEIRTPMNGIIGMTNLVLKSDLNDKQKELLNIVKKSSENLLEIINDILDFSKIESNQFTLSIDRIDLRLLLSNLINIYMHEVNKKNLKFIYKIDPSIPKYIYGDEIRINQVLTNLVNNAVKFTYKGRIILEVMLNKLNNNDITIDFIVEDTGIGIEKSKMNQLFKYFTQLDDSVLKNYKGTGLGLAISKNLANKMNGDIFVESKKGKGTIFTFNATFRLDNKCTCRPGKLIKLLFIGNDEPTQLIVKNLSKNNNILFSETESIEEGLDIYKYDEISLVIIDLESNYTDSEAIIDNFKSLKDSIPFIIISLSTVESLGKYKDIDILQKPIDVNLLNKKIKRYI